MRGSISAVLLLATVAMAGSDVTLYSEEEIAARFAALTPKDSAFKFDPPATWGPNVVVGSRLLAIDPAQPAPDAQPAIDGLPATTWTCRSGSAAPGFVLDLAQDRRFDQLVVFNRHTDQRGTGAGNNAVKRMALWAASSAEPSAFRHLGDFDLEGPAALCLKRKEGGQACSFIDRSTPNVVEIPATTARFVKVELKDAFWSDLALAEWKTTVAVSEVMLFDAQAER